jgi:hypothetical protein
MSEHWEQQINALLDGELDHTGIAALEAAAQSDPALARTLDEARELQQLLGVVPRHKTPRRLRRKLLAIPGGGVSLFPAWLRGGAVLASLALVLYIFPAGQDRPSLAEIEQGRQELALTLAYLHRATQTANSHISRRINGAVMDPVTDTTSQALNLDPVLQPYLQQEFEL